MKIGELVSYSTNGVCEITDVRRESVGGKTMEYYVLSPISDERTTIFVPTNNPEQVSKLRPLLTKEQIDELVMSMPDEHDEWIEDDRKRNETYKGVLDNGSHNELVRMIGSLYMHDCELGKNGKRLRAGDSAFFKRAESKLYAEMALVLGIKLDEVSGYIDNLLDAR